MRSLNRASLRHQRFVVTALIAAIWQAFPATALAQTQSTAEKAEDPTTTARVEVTGSKIKGIDKETSSVVYTLDRKAIEASGAQTVSEALQTMIFMGDAPNALSNNGGTAYANLRNFGPNRTLTLVNGHRWVGSVDRNGNVDLNSIPLGAVKRIDLLLDGGSVLYGSDAMTGVVNIILNDKFDGVAASASYGRYENTGAPRRDVQLTAGRTGERVSGFVGIDVRKDEPIMNSAFQDLVKANSKGPNTFSSTTPAGQFQLCTGKRSSSFTCPTASLVDPSGTMGAFTYGPGSTGANWKPYVTANDQYDPSGETYFSIPSDKQAVFGHLTVDVNDHVRLKMDAEFMHRVAYSNARAQTLNLGGGSTDPTSLGRIVIPANSYYNPFGTEIGIINREVLEAGPNITKNTANTASISPRIEGDFELFHRAFDWEMGVVDGTTKGESDASNRIARDNLRNALGPSFKDASGNIVCGTPGNVIANCVPLNLLGQGTVTQQMLDYLEFATPLATRSSYKMRDYYAQLSTGNLITLPAGPAGLAIGVEKRKEEGSVNNDPRMLAGQTLVGVPTDVSKGFGLKEAYAELQLPALANKPLVKQLDLNIAGRYSKYDNGVSSFNKKFGVKWKITNDFGMRATYSTGFRSPTIGNLTGSVATDSSLPVTGDPCSFTTDTSGKVLSNRYASLPASQQARCNSYGVPIGGYDTRTAPTATVVTGGNPEIGPERDAYHTVGMLYSPSFLPGFDVQVDWFSIFFRNGILDISAAGVLTSCLQGDLSSDVTCANNRRDANGYPTYVRAGLSNIGTGSADKGFDVIFHYRMPQSWIGKLMLTSETTYTTVAQSASDNSASSGTGTASIPPLTNQVGIYANNNPRWRVRSALRLNWSQGPFSAAWTTNYYSSLREPCAFTGTVDVYKCNALGPVQNTPDPANPQNDTFLPFLKGGNANRLGATVYHNVNFGWNTSRDGNLTLGINNVTGRAGPNSYANLRISPSFPVPDRYVYVSYGQKF